MKKVVAASVALAFVTVTAGFSSWAAASRPHDGSIKTASAPTTLPIHSVTSTSVATSNSAGAPTGTILMIKLSVGNVAAGERFYGSVFGAKAAIEVGTVPILTFPKGGPGLVLLKRGRHEQHNVSGFIIQVPNLSQTKALAVAHGAKVQDHFAGNPGNQSAQSIDLLDPWGNNVEILQIG